MKFAIVFAVCLAIVLAAPPQEDRNAETLKQESNNIGLGDFKYAYETSNGISASAVGDLKNAGTDDEAQVISGSYSYTDPEGKFIQVEYIADENGYRATGDSIPKTSF